MQVDFAYNSNHIEGSRLTHDQTRYIFETHSIDGVAYVNDIFEASIALNMVNFSVNYVKEN